MRRREFLIGASAAAAWTSAAQFAAVMPPMATQGSSIISDHHARIAGSARVGASLVAVAWKAPKAT